MAQKATIFKAEVNLANMDQDIYLDQNLTIAQHPSETLQRMMLRIVAWALHANEQLTFTKGLCEEDEPELWQKNYSDEIELWIDLGTPDEKRIKKASVRGKQAVLFTYGQNVANAWWKQHESVARKYNNLTVNFVSDETMEQLAALAQRTMQLQFSISDGDVWLSSGEESIQLDISCWQEAAQ
ncbi:YaeQ family protein [Psychrobium sp. nBUS_13]|uniref:YaeQ family protein n=1 Tax=Psychrobium sp. nBUS_13 TaxID=3395319 RepID=UPI003EC01663